MKEFVLLALKSKTTPDIDLSNLPREGRMDLVCRTVSNTLSLSNKIRRDTIVHVAMTGPKEPPKIVSFHGETLRGFEPDELHVAKMIKSALKTGLGMKLGEEKEVSPGLKVSKKAFETLIKEKSQTSQVFYLHPKGEDVRHVKFTEKIVFVFGDYIGLPRKTEKFLSNINAIKIKLGPEMLFASHCPVIVLNEIDRQQV